MVASSDCVGFVVYLKMLSCSFPFTSNRAPMSKVVEFLPQHIPRILINRNNIHLPSASTGNPSDPIFNACLLGNCGEWVYLEIA